MTDASSWERTLLLTRLALEKKACDLVVMDVRGLTSIADYFIICSGRSDRQVQSIAQGLEGNSAEHGIRLFAVEGSGRGHWVLMDFSDVIVHIFYEPVRKFYDLDGLWGHAPKAELPEPYSKLVDQFQIADGQLS
ncbi:MAG: ribosome silencing factor [Deltaproteobacteria bacterium]|nr:ribosome silencing factor [Deltaproteobacteria bacterium]MDP2605082.1 ribosome silencing factor [Deltaproteobacteria bacterium]MDZ4346724.1 ribosome silencing factor [Candidatus Binatia bacterium]